MIQLTEYSSNNLLFKYLHSKLAVTEKGHCLSSFSAHTEGMPFSKLGILHLNHFQYFLGR